MTEARHVAAALRTIETLDDPDRLRRLMHNAHEHGNEEVETAAFRRLVGILPSEQPGTLEHDFWRSIHSFEELLKKERGRTTRLARTRRKIDREGVKQTLEDFALASKPTDGFGMLMERGLAELTGEAVILRHQAHFAQHVVAAADARLREAGVDTAALPSA